MTSQPSPAWRDLPPDILGLLADLAADGDTVSAMRAVCRDWNAAVSQRLASLRPAALPPRAAATLAAAFPCLRDLDLRACAPPVAADLEVLLASLPCLEGVRVKLPNVVAGGEAASASGTGIGPVAPAEVRQAPRHAPPARRRPPAAADADADAVLPPPRSLRRIATRPSTPGSPPPPPCDDAAAAVGRGAPRARRLDFGGSAALTDAGLGRLASLALPRLEALRMDGCTALTDAGLAAAAAGVGARLTELRFASAVVGGGGGGGRAGADRADAVASPPATRPPAPLLWPATKISDAACLALAVNARRLAVLDLRGHSGVTPAGVAALAAACPLIELRLGGGPAGSDAGVAAAAHAARTLRTLRVEAVGRGVWRSAAAASPAAAGAATAAASAELLAAAFAAMPPTPASAAASAAAAAAGRGFFAASPRVGGGGAAAAPAPSPSPSPSPRSPPAHPALPGSPRLSESALTGSALALAAAFLPSLTSLALVGVEWAAGECARGTEAGSLGVALPRLTHLELSGPPRSALVPRPLARGGGDGGGGGGAASTVDGEPAPPTSPPLDALALAALRSLDVSGSGLAGGCAAALGRKAGALAALRAPRVAGLRPHHLAAVLTASASTLTLLDVRGCEGLVGARRGDWAPLAACARLVDLAAGPAAAPAGPAWFAGAGDPWAADAGLEADPAPDGGDAGSEAALAAAAGLPRLARLALAGVPLTPAVGGAVGAMPALVALSVAGCPTPPGAARPLPGPGAALAAGFAARPPGAPPPALADLDVAHTEAGGPDLAALLRGPAGAGLTRLDVTGCGWGSDPADVAALAACPRLACLAAGGPAPPGAGPGLDDGRFAALAAAAPGLTSLTLRSPGPGLTARGLRRGLAGLPRLAVLRLPGGEGLGDVAAVLAAVGAAGPPGARRLRALGLADPGGACARAAVGPPCRSPRVAAGDVAAFLLAVPRLRPDGLDLRGVEVTPGPGRPAAARAAAAAAASAGGALLAAALDAASLAALAVDTVAGAAAGWAARVVSGWWWATGGHPSPTAGAAAAA